MSVTSTMRAFLERAASAEGAPGDHIQRPIAHNWGYVELMQPAPQWEHQQRWAITQAGRACLQDIYAREARAAAMTTAERAAEDRAAELAAETGWDALLGRRDA